MEKYRNPQEEFKAQYLEEFSKEASSRFQDDIDVIDLKDILVDNYGTSWIEYYPETIVSEILGGKYNDVTFNKIMALQTVVSTDTPWLDWNIFEKVGKAFNHQIPDFTYNQPLSTGECFVTINKLKRLRPEEDDFSREVYIYIAQTARSEGYLYLPEELDTREIQGILDEYIFDGALKEEVREKWQKLRKSDKLLNMSIDEDSALQVQIGKLVVLTQYVKENI